MSNWFVANVIVGALKTSEPRKYFLLHCDILEKAKSVTITKLFDKYMDTIWRNWVKHDYVLLFVIDAAPYKVVAGKNMKPLCTKIEYVTCFVHHLYRIVKQVREYFSKDDVLISNIKNIFLKALSWHLEFKCMGLTIPLVPKPIMTRWSTWIEASVYQLFQ